LLFVSNLLPPQVLGGAEVVAWREMHGLRKRGYEVRGLTLDWHDRDPVAWESEEMPDGVLRVPAPRGAGARRPGNEAAANPELERAFDSLLAELRPAVVHFHHMNGVSLRLPARARRQGVPRVVTLHDGWGLCPKSVLVRADGSVCPAAATRPCVRCLEASGRTLSPRRRWRVWRRAHVLRGELERAQRLLFPSRHHLERYVLAGYPRSRCRVLPNPLPEGAGAFRPPPGGDPGEPLRLLFLGGLHPHKGFDVLLEALAGLPAGGVELRVHGPLGAEERAAFEARLEGLGDALRVTHGGWLTATRVQEVLAASDAVVVPSRAPENCPLTLLEALAAGRPAVASRAGGIPELIRDSENGLLFETGEARSLRDCLRRLVVDRRLLVRMARGARGSAEKLGMSAHLDALESHYDEAGRGLVSDAAPAGMS
jgi:glycosyltransferase involved in cell wall biosynthesis